MPVMDHANERLQFTNNDSVQWSDQHPDHFSMEDVSMRWARVIVIGGDDVRGET